MEKARRWWLRQDAQVTYINEKSTINLKDFDVVWLSAIFSWNVLELVRIAKAALSLKLKVEVGGPGTFGVVQYIIKELSLLPQFKPDSRFEREPGEYLYVFGVVGVLQ